MYIFGIFDLYPKNVTQTVYFFLYVLLVMYFVEKIRYENIGTQIKIQKYISDEPVSPLSTSTFSILFLFIYHNSFDELPLFKKLRA